MTNSEEVRAALAEKAGPQREPPRWAVGETGPAGQACRSHGHSPQSEGPWGNHIPVPVLAYPSLKAGVGLSDQALPLKLRTPEVEDK